MLLYHHQQWQKYGGKPYGMAEHDDGHTPINDENCYCEHGSADVDEHHLIKECTTYHAPVIICWCQQQH